MRFIRTAHTCFLSLAVLFLAAVPANAFVFPWPDAFQHPRVMTVADQDIESVMTDNKDWFSHDFLVAGLLIKDVAYGASDRAMWEWAGINYRFMHKHIFIGTYISGTTALHELSLKVYPANAASIEDMSLKVKYLGPWIRDPEQQVVDLSDPKSENELVAAIRDLWQHVPTLIRFVDNAAVHPRLAARMQPWIVYCQHIRRLRSLAESENANAVFNVYVRVWDLLGKDGEKDMAYLIDAVRGNGGNAISFPIPWSRSIKDNKDANLWAIYHYRQLLDRRISVILIPSKDATAEDLVKWTSSWKLPHDRLYIGVPYYDEPPL